MSPSLTPSSPRLSAAPLRPSRKRLELLVLTRELQVAVWYFVAGPCKLPFLFFALPFFAAGNNAAALVATAPDR